MMSRPITSFRLSLRVAALVLIAVWTMASPAIAQKITTKPFSIKSKSRGKVFESTAKDGLGFTWYVPKNYDPDRGAGLTMILHGSNLSRYWGFSNHKAGSFRPDDIVVCPDGTTPNGNGGFNFLQGKKDLKRLRAFQEEITAAVKINATYLYGHSQGSFFSFLYAGAYPKAVDGMVGHASGVWYGTAQTKKHHHQAVVFMHGTADPVVPYERSVGGFDSYRKAKYPKLRLRSLEGWNHWPAEHNGPVPHTSQQMAWVEGMTTDDPERMVWCHAYLANVKDKERHDYAALHSLSQHLANHDAAPDDLKQRATKTAGAVEALAQRHTKTLDAALAKDKKIRKKKNRKLDGKAWSVHLPLFLRAFDGVPACNEFRKRHAKLLDRHEKAAAKHLGKYWEPRRRGKIGDAFKVGLAATREGHLDAGVYWPDILGDLEKWEKNARDHKLGKRSLANYAQVVPPLRKSQEKGWKSFLATNKKYNKP